MSLRLLAIIIEVLVMTAITYTIFQGSRLVILDLGLRPRYDRLLVLLLFVLGAVLLFFFIAHHAAFYPE